MGNLPVIITIVNWLTSKGILKAGVVLLVIFFGYLSIHPFLTAWVGTLTEVYAPIKIWKDVLIGLISICVVLYILTNDHLREKVIKDPILLLSGAYVALTLFIFILGLPHANESDFAGIIFNLRFIALLFIIRVFMLSLARPSKQVQGSFDFIAKKVVVIASFVALFGIAQVLVLPDNFMSHFGYDGLNTINPISTIDDNTEARRAFSTLRGPNEFGAYLIIPILLCGEIFLRTRKWQYGLGVLVMATGLYLSHSRAAFLGLVVAVTIFSSLWFYRRFGKRVIMFGTLGAVLLFVLALFVAVNYEPARIIVFHSSSGDDSLIEGSTFDHFNATFQGIKDVIKHPLGRGVGEAGPASFYQTDGEQPRIAENYYVQIAQEVGILGLLLFISIVVLSLRQVLLMKNVPYSKSFFAGFVGVSVVALFLHTWADDPVSYTAWGLMAVILANNILPSSRFTKNT